MNQRDLRYEIVDYIRKEFIGPNPIKEHIQENGEEIIFIDSPRIRYLTGVLFPQGVKLEEDYTDDKNKQDNSYDNYYKELMEINEKISKLEEKDLSQPEDVEEDIINLSNTYKQSAISLTSCLKLTSDLEVLISFGVYKKNKDCENRIQYLRQHENVRLKIELPIRKGEKVEYIINSNGEKYDLKFVVINRGLKDDNAYYTFSLVNTKTVYVEDSFKDEDCFFQVQFKIISNVGFIPLPEDIKSTFNCEDYQINKLLYRDVKTYAVGHGCAAEWDISDDNIVKHVNTTFIPTYEVKPIVPTNFDNIEFKMYEMSDLGKIDYIFRNLLLLCDEYEKWINNLNQQAKILEKDYYNTAVNNIDKCRITLNRMRSGVELLKNNDVALKSFRYMNRAMLLQQIHHSLPLNKWIENENKETVLESRKPLPNINNPETWGENKGRIGKWRPFQIAFILMNLNAVIDSKHPDRNIVDLIWFPTGGGKTEAYLGLSAFQIFCRRLKNPDNTGTSIIMRYTLRLLTTQQYERAASLICACETIRQEKSEELGRDRITIGLWVGQNLSPNKTEDARDAFTKMQRGASTKNPFLLLKCPWCGAQMGQLDFDRTLVKGYRTTKTKRVIYKCDNEYCMFSTYNNPLPLIVVDEEIYNEPPTLLLATVDKFALLPYISDSRSLFGRMKNKNVTPPELIIQDELHLISGPLGSMVGHYETLVYELCKNNDDNSYPKIICSTATISRAKEQCNALYGCHKDNVNQFPSPGIDAGDSFFSRVDSSQPGRLYVGICCPAASSFATSNIRLFSALLFAANEIEVQDEKERDPYWTNLGYFNSLRELGQAATWITADIDEYLHNIYIRSMKLNDEYYKYKRRYIYKYEELTSRIDSSEVSEILQKLNISYNPPYIKGENDRRPIDICLATNMISVGVDIPRLGLMTVVGQPKTTSEYIQATSRVGRRYPGLVFTMYNPTRPRDKSHYEHFVSYHSKLYFNVEPTSVTPFSPSVRQRALHAIILGYIRLVQENDDPRTVDKEQAKYEVETILKNRVLSIDPDEMKNTLKQLNKIFEKWDEINPIIYSTFFNGKSQPLMYPQGTEYTGGWTTPTSMRSVDATSILTILDGYLEDEIEDDSYEEE